MRRKIGVTAFAVAALALASVPAVAVAGKGGNGGGGGSGSGSSIALASVNSAAASSPRLGDSLRFATTVEPLAGWEYPMIALSCYQDVNGDGKVDTSLLGPDIVFSWLDRPDASYTLGGYASIWTQRGGGDAMCRADLDAYGWKGGHQSIRLLASTGDWAASG